MVVVLFYRVRLVTPSQALRPALLHSSSILILLSVDDGAFEGVSFVTPIFKFDLRPIDICVIYLSKVYLVVSWPWKVRAIWFGASRCCLLTLILAVVSFVYVYNVFIIEVYPRIHGAGCSLSHHSITRSIGAENLREKPTKTNYRFPFRALGEVSLFRTPLRFGTCASTTVFSLFVLYFSETLSPS